MTSEPATDRRSDRTTMSRRTALGLGAATLAGAMLGAEASTAAAAHASRPEPADPLVDRLRPEIAPREAWGADLPPAGPLVPEDDVRFLLVHHTASTNGYGPDDVTGLIRGFYAYHTGPDKGWPDVAYNFFVDRFGGIWEARAGSLAGPVRGDATGGSQGFALLCSLIGNHAEVPVSAEAQASLVSLLAWLAERHEIPTEPGTTVDFTSRGSNLWPTGATVTAATISGHRDMSETTCPGDFAYDLIGTELPRAVTDLRRSQGSVGQTPSTSSTTTPSPTLVTPERSEAPDGAAPAAVTEAVAESAPEPETGAAAAQPSDGAEPGDGPLDDARLPAALAGGAAMVGAAALATRHRNRRA